MKVVLLSSARRRGSKTELQRISNGHIFRAGKGERVLSEGGFGELQERSHRTGGDKNKQSRGQGMAIRGDTF